MVFRVPGPGSRVSKMAINPFHFKLKKVSERQQRLVDALYAYLPATGMEEQFGRGVGEAVARHVGEDFSFRLEALHHEPYTSFLSKLPQPAVMAVVGLAPLARKAIIEIDTQLAMSAIERMLGGHSETVFEPRPLSDTEQGVLQYLLLQLLAHVHRIARRNERVHFRFERFAFMPHEVRDLAGEHDDVAILVYRVSLGRRSGFVRLCLPDPFVEESFLDVASVGEARVAEWAQRLKQISRFSYVRVPLWAEAGQASLSANDLKQLEEGDIILFDHSDISIADSRASGSVILRIGSGLHGGIETDISVDEKRVHCCITGIHKGE